MPSLHMAMQCHFNAWLFRRTAPGSVQLRSGAWQFLSTPCRCFSLPINSKAVQCYSIATRIISPLFLSAASLSTSLPLLRQYRSALIHGGSYLLRALPERRQITALPPLCATAPLHFILLPCSPIADLGCTLRCRFGASPRSASPSRCCSYLIYAIPSQCLSPHSYAFPLRFLSTLCFASAWQYEAIPLLIGARPRFAFPLPIHAHHIYAYADALFGSAWPCHRAGEGEDYSSRSSRIS